MDSTISTDITVPERHRPVLEKALRYSAEARASILGAIQSAEPKLSKDAFVDGVASRTKLPKGELADLLEVLVSMYMAMDRDSIPVESFVSGVCESLERDKITPEGSDWAPFKSWLTSLLSLDLTLGVAAKALGLLLEYEFTYCQGRIMTDLRPIFKHDPSVSPGVGLIVHQLRLAVHTEETEEHKEFYVAMDHDDLMRLKGLVERALAKEASLRALVEKGGMKILEA